MTYKTEMKQLRKHRWDTIKHHPYFGFLIIVFLMFAVQLIRLLGVDVPVAVLRAFGSTMIFTIIALGFSILLGYGGLASLGTAGFVGLGSYFVVYFTNQLEFSIFLTIVAVLIVAVVLGTVVGFISLRIEGMYLAIITLGLSEILNEVFKRATALTGGTTGEGIDGIIFFKNLIAVDHNTVFIFISIVLFIIMLLTMNIMKSPTGRALLAMRNSSSAAQAMGVSIFRYRLLAFIISTVYAMLAGVLYMTYWSFTIPSTWSLGFSLNILAAVIVGGSQSIYGIILGTFMIFGLDLAVFKQIQFFVDNPAITIVLNGVLIIVVIMFYPGGLIRLVQTLGVKLKLWFQKLKKKWRDYYYGSDIE
ncbi:MAG: branched-chain amino acid ABC transporter permease [Bacilli bacterium]|nr:branched-chain amino acid ABC transporter permease [Bacilli bacterium]MBN2877663.1 branched-chain amino acid ABC transporter permease [Bacilli bacterium]